MNKQKFITVLAVCGLCLIIGCNEQRQLAETKQRPAEQTRIVGVVDKNGVIHNMTAYEAEVTAEVHRGLKLGMTTSEVRNLTSNGYCSSSWKLMMRHSNGCEVYECYHYQFTFCDGILTDWKEFGE